jgi:hypothetical protein
MACFDTTPETFAANAARRQSLFITRPSKEHPWPKEIEADMEAYKQCLIDYYRVDGFPVYALNLHEQYKQLNSLLKNERKARIRGGIVGQSMTALGLAWHYFPHAWGVRCGKKLSSTDVFHNDTHMLMAIDRLLKYSTYISDVSMRKALRFVTKAQGTSNFRPTAAIAIYRQFLPKEGGVVWDMSAGYGGRLLGAIACRRVKKYIGTDPASPTMQGLEAMKAELVPMAVQLGRRHLEVDLHQCGSEVHKVRAFIKPESLEVCFTSPPYGPGHEKYSNEPTQSYITFPTNDEWMNGFMKQTLANCHYGLKPEGTLVINIAKVTSYPTLHTDFVALAEQNGWRLRKTLTLTLSTIMGTRPRGTKKKKHKLEPIYVFSKA